jgi:hypothetical protein
VAYSIAGDTLWVAKGTYQPDSNAAFNLKNGVAIYGGFTGVETTLAARNWATNVTILKGNAHPVIRTLATKATAILDGFTITGGTGLGLGPTDGGGMYNQNSFPTLNNIIFLNNTASHGGGGMYNTGSASPTLTNVIFLNNTAALTGGGMENADSSSPKLINVLFSNNAAKDGAGIYNISTGSTTLTNVTFLNNTAAFFGGGMNNGASGLTTLTNVTFSNNTANYFGGGMYNNNNDSTILTNVIFSNNTASNNGGGVYNTGSGLSFINATFSNNTSLSDGGGVYNANSSSPTLTNCIFWGNTDSGSGMPDINNDSSSSSTVTYCFTQTTTPGAGNIKGTTDPFVNDANPVGSDGIFGTTDDGLQLIGCSSAVNTGNNIADTSTTDITGQPRIFNTTIDMGAYEYQSYPDGTSLAIAGDSAFQTIYPGSEALIADSSCRIIAQILPSGSSPVADTVTAKVYIDSTVLSYNGQPYVQRHIDITPVTNAATATATVTIFATQAEFDSLNNYSSVKLPTGPTDYAGIANLNVIQFHGISATGTPGTYSGATITIDPADSNIVWNSTLNRWQITFTVTGFSGFIIVANGGIVLPLDLLSFTGKLVYGLSQLQWQTANELNTDHFEIDKSTDGKTFSYLTTVKAIGTGNNSYTTVDAQTQIGNNYYRLKSVDKDGSFTYSNIVLIDNDGNTKFVVYPNPTSKQLVVEYDNTSNATIAICNLAGQEILSIPTNGEFKTTIDVSDLATGTYLIEYNNEVTTLRSKFIKVN